MFSTRDKTETLRTAKAQAVLIVKPAIINRLVDKTVPKGDALEVAKTAGILAAKKTSEIIPFCHPIPLDSVTINITVGPDSVQIIATVEAVWKTGVEMEALVAVQIAAATLFDMLKPLDPEMTITDVRVLEKSGGKTSFVETLPVPFRTAVLVTSDGTFEGKRTDRSGQLILERFQKAGITDPTYLILPDDAEKIGETLLRLCEEGYHLVVTTGGTGLGPRDVTATVTRGLLDREIPGIAEAARAHGQRRTPYAMLSAAVAGLKKNTLIVNLPGSSRGVKECLDAIFPAILHSYKMMRGGGHP